MVPRSTITPNLSLLDRKIIPLVRYINKLGISTFYSCEGHVDTKSSQSKFPLVIVSPSNKEKEALAFLRFVNMIGIHNGQKKFKKQEEREKYICWDFTPREDGTILLKPQNQNNNSLFFMHKGLTTLVKNLKLADRWYQVDKPFV